MDSKQRRRDKRNKRKLANFVADSVFDLLSKVKSGKMSVDDAISEIEEFKIAIQMEDY